MSELKDLIDELRDASCGLPLDAEALMLQAAGALERLLQERDEAIKDRDCSLKIARGAHRQWENANNDTIDRAIEELLKTIDPSVAAIAILRSFKTHPPHE